MSDLDLNEIKRKAKDSKESGGWSIRIPEDDFNKLIAEVERLRSDIKLFEAMRDGVGDRIEDLEAENANAKTDYDLLSDDYKQLVISNTGLKEKLAASEKARKELGNG